jgi:hypothetical protein
MAWFMVLIIKNGKFKKQRRYTMKPNIQKILYATDLSLNSTYALSYAMKMAIKQ